MKKPPTNNIFYCNQVFNFLKCDLFINFIYFFLYLYVTDAAIKRLNSDRSCSLGPMYKHMVYYDDNSCVEMNEMLHEIKKRDIKRKRKEVMRDLLTAL